MTIEGYSIRSLQLQFKISPGHFQSSFEAPVGSVTKGQKYSQMSANYSTQSVRDAAAYPPHQHLETPSKQSTNQQCVIPALPTQSGHSSSLTDMHR